jgi:hypothetical protein
MRTLAGLLVLYSVAGCAAAHTATITSYPPAASARDVPTGLHAWGPSSSGLRMGIVSGNSPQPSVGAEFFVTLQNAGDADFILNLGAMFGNGKVMSPSAIRLLLTDAAGRTRELHFSERFGVAPGRIDDFIVALNTGSTYVLRVTLDRYWSPSTKEFIPLRVTTGRYLIAARFDGRTAQTHNLDMPGIDLLNFWTGTLTSGSLEFEVAGDAAV